MKSVKEVAKILGVDPSRVRALIKSKRITAHKVGATWAVTGWSRVLVRKNGRPKS